MWWTFLFWLPDFFAKRYGVDLKHYGPPLIAIYVLADIGSVLGGWSSSAFLKRGLSLNAARKTAMLSACARRGAGRLRRGRAKRMDRGGADRLGVAGHQGFSANLYALPSDLFPRWAAGSVIGLGGFAGALGGMLMAKYAGWVLQTVGSYAPIFAVAACAYLFALAVVHFLSPRYAPAAAYAT